MVEYRSKILVFFTFFINVFIKTLIQSIIDRQIVLFERLLVLWKLYLFIYFIFTLFTLDLKLLIYTKKIFV